MLLFDEIGDRYNAGPHLLVEQKDGWLLSKSWEWLEPEENESRASQRTTLGLDNAKRVAFFPKPLPDETEKYREMIQKRTEEYGRKGRDSI